MNSIPDPFCERRPRMSQMGQACFQGTPPMDLLVSYVLYLCDDFRRLCYLDRVRIRFLFQQFSRKFITPDQFMNMASFFPCIVDSARKLVQVCLTPRDLMPPSPPRCWSPEETMILLAGATLDSDNNLPSLLPARPASAWRKRVSRVLAELQQAKMLDDEPITRLEVRQTSQITISGLDNRRLYTGRVTQGIRLARALNLVTTEANASKARLHKSMKALARAREEGACSQGAVASETCAHEPEKTNHTDEPLALFQVFMEECNRNFKAKPNGRRYSEVTYDICELLRTTSRKTYRLLRMILPLPSTSALYRKYSNAVKRRKKVMTDLDSATKFLKDVMLTQEMESVPITIGIDAFSFRTFSGNTIDEGSAKREQYSNGFAFVHIPLDSKLAPHVIYLHPKENGAYDKNIDSAFEAIRAAYQKRGVPVWFKATDGDRYMTGEHESFFDKYVAPYRHDFTLVAQHVHDKLCKGLTMPIPDPLHYAKNLRGKILDHQIAIVDHEEVIFLIDLESIKSVLDLGSVLDDRTQLGRMRDVYVTQLFTLKNVCTLLEANMHPVATLFLPYACIFTLLFATNLQNSTRVFLAKLAYYCFNHLLDECQSLAANTPTIKYRFCSGTTAVTMAEPSYIKRMMHSCISFGVSLLFGPRSLRLDALGTHLVENSIGIARSIANSTKYTTILSAFSCSELRKDIAKKYNIQLRVSKRVNDGGAKVDTLSDKGIVQPDSWDAADIASTFVEACNIDLLDQAREDLKKIFSELKEFAEGASIIKLTETSDVANALILQRYYKFKADSEETSSETSSE